jgi:hypothetical protein
MVGLKQKLRPQADKQPRRNYGYTAYDTIFQNTVSAAIPVFGLPKIRSKVLSPPKFFPYCRRPRKTSVLP